MSDIFSTQYKYDNKKRGAELLNKLKNGDLKIMDHHSKAAYKKQLNDRSGFTTVTIYIQGSEPKHVSAYLQTISN